MQGTDGQGLSESSHGMAHEEPAQDGHSEECGPIGPVRGRVKGFKGNEGARGDSSYRESPEEQDGCEAERAPVVELDL